jgi:hypothetical protein
MYLPVVADMDSAIQAAQWSALLHLLSNIGTWLALMATALTIGFLVKKRTSKK